MAKEMIVSVNGREKKIAILDDGKVTEFYIERGEENSGVVGNIYKGRVMRVLPGMQSAFVDIGLERDAFLYVSDFFDEEEEFERIVLEKAKKTDVNTAEKVASEKLQQARLEREQAMESLQERSEPLLSATKKEFNLPAKTANQPAPVKSENVSPTNQSVTDNSVLFDESATESSDFSSARKLENVAAAEADEAAEIYNRRGSDAPEILSVRVQPIKQITESSEVTDSLALGDSSFERVVDDEEANIQPGEMFKEARIQERLTDQVRAIEFDIEPTPYIEVGTLMLNQSGGGEFERIDDGDNDQVSEQKQATAAKTATPDPSQSKTAAKAPARAKRSKSKDVQVVEEVEETESEISENETTETEEAAFARRKKNRGGRRKSGSDPKANQISLDAQAETDGANDQQVETKNANRNSVNDLSSANVKLANSDKAIAKATNASASTEAGDTAESNTKAAMQTELGDASESSVADAITEIYANADASVDDLGAFREEMAVRRGGRRRRGGRGGSRQENGENGDEHSSNGDDSGNDAAGDVETEVEEADELNVEESRADNGNATQTENTREPQRMRENQTTRERSDRNERGNGHERPAHNERNDRNDRNERNDRNAQQRNERHERNERNDRPNNERGDRGERSERSENSRRDRRPPTITDLLREGQEVLVQIAKEPIAKKGARITSHIALPGRYIVYMPTVEHVGVSRKIESSSERIRLRNMIQKIRNEEDVPSGGFIVRTAGIGITEQNLRDDARYLVRTWQDIRKVGEKAKSPNLVHQDLDLVERILRDQLSEEFTAIRVDDEAEYLRVVEFINRIQPRMTNRVKLYTRDQPIMENYGVQEEIDKAVKPRVWLKSGGYLVINQTEALVSIDVNTGKFVGGKGGNNRLEDTITKTNMEAVDEIARQVRLRDLGGIIVLDLIDMEDKRNRQKVLQALQEALQGDKSPTKVLSFNDFGLVIMTRKRVKQSLERTLCSPCSYCEGAGLIKSPQTVAYEILAEARSLSKGFDDDGIKQTTLRVHPEIAKALRTTERDVLTELEDYLGAVDLTSDAAVHQEQFDFAFI